MKILFVACYSPLINNSAAIETLWYLNKLSDIEDNEVHVITVDFPKNSIYYDEDVIKLLSPKVKLHIVDGGWIFNLVMPKKKSSEHKVSKSSKGRMMKFLKKIKNIVAIPDAYVFWTFKSYKYIKSTFKQDDFDIVFSMHEPPSSHLAAYKFKNYFKTVKWITYWSDPWIEDASRKNYSFLRRYFENSLEKSIVDNCSSFVFVTEANRNDYIHKYNIPREKTFLINRGYDKRLYSKLKNETLPILINKEKINIVYTGEIFSRLRNIVPFIETLDIIKEKNKELYLRLNVLFFGNIDDLEALERLKNHDCVRVSGRIPYEEALKYVLNSELLILLGNKNSNQIPAKIYDYFGSEAYIFTILGDEKDPILNLVNNNSKCIVTNNNKIDIYNNLKYAIKKLEDKDSCKAIEDYEWSNIAVKLNNILKG